MKKLFFIIGEERSKFFIFFINIFLVILETIGIAVILPIISFFSSQAFQVLLEFCK